MATVGYPPGLLGLVLRVQELGAEVTHYRGGAVGIRGRAVGRVPADLWAALRREAALLRRLVLPEATPYQRRRQRGLA